MIKIKSLDSLKTDMNADVVKTFSRVEEILDCVLHTHTGRCNVILGKCTRHWDDWQFCVSARVFNYFVLAAGVYLSVIFRLRQISPFLLYLPFSFGPTRTPTASVFKLPRCGDNR